MTISVSKKHIVFFLVAGSAFRIDAYAQKKNSPNIILILADDLGYGDISVYNPNSKINTPNIDNIAKEGIMFTDAHSNSSVCTPTRYGILTGRYSWRTKLEQGVLNGYSEPLIDEDRLTVASLLKSKGYNTACIGKWHLGWHWPKDDLNKERTDFTKPISGGPNSLGFDYFYGISASLDMPPYIYVENNKVVLVPEQMTENLSKMQLWRNGPVSPDFKHGQCLQHLTTKAVECISEYSKDENPFFLYFSLTSPHTPILPSEGFKGKSGIGDYGDFVIETDSVIGQIITMLKKLKIDNNTLLIFTSDNGCSPAAGINELENQGHFPSAQFRGYKADLYEGGHRVPFVLSWPNGIKNHGTYNQLISTTDLLATIAQLTGYKLSNRQGEDSYSFYSIFSDNSPQNLRRASIIHHSYYGDFAIRKGDWKLLMTPFSGGWSFPMQGQDNEKVSNLAKIQLYNLRKDVAETTDLSLQYPEKVSELKKLLIKDISRGRSTKGKKQQNDRYVKCNF